MSESMRVGLVLSAGGVRGLLAHAGFLQAVDTMGIRFDAIAGCSSGGVVAACYAAGLDARTIRDGVLKLRSRDFYHPMGWFRMAIRLMFGRGRGLTGLANPEVMIRAIAKALPVEQFSKCRIPLSLISVNLDKGEKEILDRGNLARAAAASAAIPLLFSPVRIGDTAYCDGGAYERTPNEAICCRHHLDLLVVHEIATDELDMETRNFDHRNWSPLRLAGRLFYTWTRTAPLSAPRHELCPCGCGAHILTLQPQLPVLSLMVDPDTNSDVLEAATRFAETCLQNLYSTQTGWNFPDMEMQSRQTCGRETK